MGRVVTFTSDVAVAGVVKGCELLDIGEVLFDFVPRFMYFAKK